MKSIVQEASSIEKAIQKAWEEAGQPLEFSIRILEHPKRNFFGFLKRSAKVAMVFPSAGKQETTRERKNLRNDRPRKDQRTETRSSDNSPRSTKKTPQDRSKTNNQNQEKPKRREESSNNQQQDARSELSRALSKEKKQEPISNKNKTNNSDQPSKNQEKKAPLQIRPTDQVWEPELVAKIDEQIKTILGLMGKDSHQYSATVQGRELIINFSGLLLQTEDQDRRLFSGLSPLLMTMIKREFKKALRGYRIVLGHVK